MKETIRKFPPGSEWLFIRTYGGAQALEEWMAIDLVDLLTSWKQSGWVRSFHYVHYLDPDYHIRLRFLLDEPVRSGMILSQIQESCSILLKDDLIWKIELGTYEPEYERYGFERMHLVEKWFEMDSFFWLGEIRRSLGQEDPETWKMAVRKVDQLLNGFGASIDDKIIIINKLKDQAFSLIGMTRAMKGQLDQKYRKVSVELDSIFLLNAMDESKPGILDFYSDPHLIYGELRGTFSGHTDMMESPLLPDLIHLSLNRGFRTRHRLQELVVYDLMSRYYESSRAKGLC
jgi:thiopeptide-type bacteriocin biosynthesis protein